MATVDNCWGFIYFVTSIAMSTHEGAEHHKQKAEITHYMQATKT